MELVYREAKFSRPCKGVYIVVLKGGYNGQIGVKIDREANNGQEGKMDKGGLKWARGGGGKNEQGGTNERGVKMYSGSKNG